jgi:hypothetical protein
MLASNLSFTRVTNSTEQLSNLNVSDAKAGSLSVGSITAGNVNLVNAVPGVGTLHQVLGYAPMGFEVASANDTMFLNVRPGSTVATDVTDSQLLVLPAGAQILNVVVTNNGTVISGGTTFDIGTEVWSSTPTGTSNIGAAVLLTSMNSGVTFGSISALAFGTAGTALAPLTATAENTCLSIQTLSVDNTTGDVAVLVEYLL